MNLVEELKDSAAMRSDNPELCFNNDKKKIEILDVVLFLYYKLHSTRSN